MGSTDAELRGYVMSVLVEHTGATLNGDTIRLIAEQLTHAIKEALERREKEE